MTGVRMQTVAAGEGGMRLDRWLRLHVPAIGRGRLEKLLRTGQIRVDGGRVRSGHRLTPGQTVRIPPAAAALPVPGPTRGDAGLAEELADRICHIDREVLVIDKPPGLAVQGGTGIGRHLDAALDGLRMGADERPRLVHRLDRDTSGVLVLARSAAAARWLARAFRDRTALKVYWCVVVGELRPVRATVTLPIAKMAAAGREKMQVDHDGGRRAVTDYEVVEQLGHRVAWVAVRPRTGRTHQIRVHMAALGTPVLGDGKYGGRDAFIDADGLARRLHLHARSISIPRPGGARLEVRASLPDHMVATWRLFGFSGDDPAPDWPEA